MENLEDYHQFKLQQAEVFDF